MSAVDMVDDVAALRSWRAEARRLAEERGGDSAAPFLPWRLESCFDGSDLTPNQRIRACSQRIVELGGSE